jgi:hypothetical protein
MRSLSQTDQGLAARGHRDAAKQYGSPQDRCAYSLLQKTLLAVDGGFRLPSASGRVAWVPPSEWSDNLTAVKARLRRRG